MNSEIERGVDYIVRGKNSQEDRAKAIFYWMVGNIKYGRDKKKRERNSIETFYDREGICCDQTVLFMSMARYAGVDADYVKVTRDNRNKKLLHACVGINPGRLILVDHAYKEFDVKHRRYEIVSDEYAITSFRAFRHPGSIVIGNYCLVVGTRKPANFR
jgi:phenylpropionate dioxygenase-like ring-hydroxylating dioxygenase large terminal subunit